MTEPLGEQVEESEELYPPADTWFYGIWFADDKQGCNWLAQLYRRDDKWVLLYRFCYSQSGRPFAAENRKSWYCVRTPDGSNEQLAKLLAVTTCVVLPSMAAKNWSVDFVDLQCRNTDPKFFFEIASRPWMHCQFLPAEENPCNSTSTPAPGTP